MTMETEKSFEEREGERRGDWMLTFTGRPYWPADPRPEDVDLGDIAHALANLCRFGGHTRKHYSVAQHSVMVSYLVPPELAAVALLHDAAEAYLGDVVRPLKSLLARQYSVLEQLSEQVIAQRFGLPAPPWPAEVKHADNVVLSLEREALLDTPPRPFRQFCTPGELVGARLKLAQSIPFLRVETFLTWDAALSETIFLLRAKRLGLLKLEELERSMEGLKLDAVMRGDIAPEGF